MSEAKARGCKLYPVFVDTKIIEMTQNSTPLRQLIPRYNSEKIKIKPNKLKIWWMNFRLKIAFWIGGNELENLIEY